MVHLVTVGNVPVNEGYPWAKVHPVTGGNIPANEHVPGVTEIAGLSANASQTNSTRARDKSKTLKSLKIKYIKNKNMA